MNTSHRQLLFPLISLALSLGMVMQAQAQTQAQDSGTAPPQQTEAIATGVTLAPVTRRTLSEARSLLTIDGSEIQVRLSDPSLYRNKDLFLDWISYSAQALQHYYGRFPVKRISLVLKTFDGGGVSGGVQISGPLPVINVTVGNLASAAELRKDWIMVHEMIHLALADLPPQNAWLEEGLAVYVESIARVQVGAISESAAWRGFLSGMPQGLPQSGDRGLDRTPTWGRKYWGGALFCLLADIQIRQRSDGQLSLRDALRGIIDAGYSTNVDATIRPVLKAADAATGIDVLLPLYEKMRADPSATPSLRELWQSLGVSLAGNEVHYDNDAPLAHIRTALFAND